MRNIEDLIVILYKNVAPNMILSNRIQYSDISKETFSKLAEAYLQHYSGCENELLYEHLANTFCEMDARHRNREKASGTEKLDVFSPLFMLAEDVLFEDGHEILCHYEKILNWRRVTRIVGEELMVTAFCAMNDTLHGRMRSEFRWSLVLGHNNVQLNRILSQGIVENHFHLWASAPVFQLSWVRLMNDLEQRSFYEMLEGIERQKRYKQTAYDYAYQEEAFGVQYLQAALLRVFLFSWLTGKKIKLMEYQVNCRDILPIIQNDLRIIMQEWRIDDLEPRKDAFSRSFQHYKESHRHLDSNNVFLMYEFLDNLGITEKEVLEWRREEEGAKTFWNLLMYRFKGNRKIELRCIKPLLHQGIYDNLWQKSTEMIVQRALMDSDELFLLRKNLQMVINALRQDEVDYTVPHECLAGYQEEDAVSYLIGERYFLYHMFRKIFRNPAEAPGYYNWFYAYLVLKENISGEMLQCNSEIGLQNFILYEKRKNAFVQGDFWQEAVVRLAVNHTLKNRNILCLEARISPCDTVWENMEYIKNMDRIIGSQEELRKRYHYVVHFIKQKESLEAAADAYSCRDAQKRKEINQKAIVFGEFREKCPVYAQRVLGIDAAAQEIGCRPEVFAQSFRYLRNHAVDIKSWDADEIEVKPLRVTYHVGEDFVDIVDGLRAIHEAICFLNMDCGDRLGHALALGIDAEQWYRAKNSRILITQQDYLDNLAWLYGQISRHKIVGLEMLLQYIHREFEQYFKIVYGDHMDIHYLQKLINEKKSLDAGRLSRSYLLKLDCNILTYYNAWKLRGDNPECYANGVFSPCDRQFGLFQEYAVNKKYPRDSRLRNITEVGVLYHSYHFNEDIKREGQRSIQVQIPDCWIDGIRLIQKEMQKHIAAAGIGIETNPSSNYAIGTFRDYARHPITEFYNYNLVSDSEKLKDCAQISVSINTDDQGIFATSLENEYALVACALEHKHDREGNPVYMRNMIYEWIDKVREMGIRQSFRDV